MKVKIDDICTACGLCIDTCPEVFEMGEQLAQIKCKKVPAEFEPDVQKAADECPVEAILII